jgi:hypothetical protein
MEENPFQPGDSIPVESIPETLLNRVGPDASERMKGLIAKAALPMPPEELGVALAILARDEDAEISESAVASLKDMPPEVLEQIVSSGLPGEVLDVYSQVFRDEFKLLQRMVANQAVLDLSVAWIAGNLRGRILDVVASNQVRLVREPKIIEAMIANPAAPTPILARIIETAIRNGVDTSGVAGFKPLAQAFFSDLNLDQAPAQSDEGPEDTEEFEEYEDDVDGGGFDEDLFAGMGIDDAELEALLTGGSAGLVEEDSQKKPMWKMIGEMSVPQKVRLAMMGDGAARKMLIRDPKKTVSHAVLGSPRLTYKEIAIYAHDKSLDGELIRKIASNREWTRNYSVIHSLVQNPKCPPNATLTFIKSLRRRDLQILANMRDVPSTVRRTAKNMLNKRGS